MKTPFEDHKCIDDLDIRRSFFDQDLKKQHKQMAAACNRCRMMLAAYESKVSGKGFNALTQPMS